MMPSLDMTLVPPSTPEPDLSTTGGRVLATRLLRKMTQAQFGKLIGVGQNAVSMWESNERTPRLEEAIVLCRRTGITLDWLYQGNLAGLPMDLAAKLTAPSDT